MVERLGIFQRNHAVVEELNRTNQGQGVSFEMNFTGDWSDEEWYDMQGLKPQYHDDEARSAGDYDSATDPVRLGGVAESVNWVTAGKMGPVKSQGGCGSCWAFAATTAQEAAQAIKGDTSPVRLSEQEGVDCVARSGGCDGGWMDHYWSFSMEAGSQTNEDYPYQG